MRLQQPAIHTLRALCLQRAGVLVHPHGTATLDVGTALGDRRCSPRLERFLET